MNENVVGDTLSELARSIDEHGSLVSIAPADWIVCFVPGLRRQWWHRFVTRRHKHVFAMRAIEGGSWLLVEPWWTRLMITVLSPADALRFLRWGDTGDMLRVRESIPGNASQMRGWSNCAVLTAFMLGRSSRAWSPSGLYEELLRDQGTQRETLERLVQVHFADGGGPRESPAVPINVARPRAVPWPAEGRMSPALQ
jgi:hypothetical protein